MMRSITSWSDARFNTEYKMKIFIHAIEKDRISIDVRAESEDGEMVGDLFLEVRPDEKFLSWSFPQLEALGLGEYDLDQGLDVPGQTRTKTAR